MHEVSLGDGEAGALGLRMRGRTWLVRVCMHVRTRAGGLLRTVEDLAGALVPVQGADVLAGALDPPRGRQDGGGEQDRDGRDGPPNQDREHESAD